jgi:hypothetical protein
MVSWEPGEDQAAAESFKEVFDYLNKFRSQDLDDIKKRDVWLAGLDKEDARSAIVPDSLRGLNLIGRRKFVIILKLKKESNPNNLLLHLSKKISWCRRINVEIFPAAYVFEVETIFREDKLEILGKPEKS